MTAAQLKSRTAKDLAQLAKRKGIAGWHSMRKDELVQALIRFSKTEAAKRNGSNGAHDSVSARKNGKSLGTDPSRNGQSHGNGDRSAPSRAKSTKTERRLNQIKAKLAQSKDLAYRTPNHGGSGMEDRLVVAVRDPYWLHAYWELTRQSIERARAALGPQWHGAKPVLRVMEVARDGTTSSVRKVSRDIEIHGGVNNWYVDVDDPPKSFQLEIGYLALEGRFLSLARSNVVTTPQVGALRSFDGNWSEPADDYHRIYTLSEGCVEDGDHSDLKDLCEHRLRRPMGSPVVTRFGRGAGCGEGSRREFNFEVDAELIVYGVTEPDAHVTLKGEPVRLASDGTFSMRFSLPDRRQVVPVVANSGDGVEQRTIVLAVERNTKVMEPVIREPDV
jgi:hypothetical protein